MGSANVTTGTLSQPSCKWTGKELGNWRGFQSSPVTAETARQPRLRTAALAFTGETRPAMCVMSQRGYARRVRTVCVSVWLNGVNRRSDTGCLYFDQASSILYARGP